MADLSLRMARIETLFGDIHFAIVGQFRSEKTTVDCFEHAGQASCPLAQDLPSAQRHTADIISSSKRRRLRATRTRKRLWHSSKTGDDGDAIGSTVWENLEPCQAPLRVHEPCNVEAPPGLGACPASEQLQYDKWTQQQMSDWIRDTLRLANDRYAVAIEEQKSKQQCLEVRAQVILDCWATGKYGFPDALHAEILQMLLDEPGK